MGTKTLLILAVSIVVIAHAEPLLDGTVLRPRHTEGAEGFVGSTNAPAMMSNPKYIAYWRTMQVVWICGFVAPFDINAVSDKLDAYIKTTDIGSTEHDGWIDCAKLFNTGLVQLGAGYDWTQSPPAQVPQ